MGQFIQDHVYQQLKDECIAMTSFILSSGKHLPNHIIEDLHIIQKQTEPNEQSMQQLGIAHGHLAQCIRPATPGSILYLYKEQQRNSKLLFLGATPLVRRLTTFTLLMLISLIGLGLTTSVNYKTINQGLLSGSGLELLLNVCFILSCAALGACFAALYRINQYISSATYDPKYDSTYWMRIVLGIISGLFLVELLPPEMFSDLTTQGKIDKTTSISHLGKPAMALLGGFSATLVNTILQRLVDTVESLFKGDQQKMIKQKEELVIERTNQQNQQKMSIINSRLEALSTAMEHDPKVAQEQLQQLKQQLHL